jgi:hypothetical protein
MNVLLLIIVVDLRVIKLYMVPYANRRADDVIDVSVLFLRLASKLFNKYESHSSVTQPYL